MIVRGWVMVGPHDSGSELPQEMYAGQWIGQPPKATDFQVGQWLIWQYAQIIHAQMVLVCVDIPLLRPGD